jgi:hypothetical protein
MTMVNMICRLLLILVASCCALSYAGEKTYEKRVPAPAGGRLSVALDSGSASVVGSDTHEVVVRAEMLGPDDVLSQVTVSTEQDASGVRVVEHAVRTHWFWFWPTPTRIHFMIEVPRDYPAQIMTQGGSLELQGLHAAIECTTAGGSITLRDVGGPVNAHTAGGGITGDHLNGPVTLSTSGGSIHVTQAKGDLDARTAGGGISLDGIDGAVSAETSGGSVYAAVLGDHDISLQTSGGGIHLRVAATIHATVDARTLGGSVHSDIPVTVTGDSGSSHLHGTINGTGHTIRLHTGGGSIRVEPLA